MQPACFSKRFLRHENVGPPRKIRKWTWAQGWAEMARHLGVFASVTRDYKELKTRKDNAYVSLLEVCDRSVYRSQFLHAETTAKAEAAVYVDPWQFTTD